MWHIGTSVDPSGLIMASKTRRSPLPLPGPSGGGDPPSAGLRYQRTAKDGFQQWSLVLKPRRRALVADQGHLCVDGQHRSGRTTPAPLQQIVLVRHSPRGTRQSPISPLVSSRLKKALKGLGGLARGARRQPVLVRLLLFAASGSAPFDGSRDRMKRRFRQQHGGHHHLPWLAWVLDGATAARFFL